MLHRQCNAQGLGAHAGEYIKRMLKALRPLDLQQPRLGFLTSSLPLHRSAGNLLTFGFEIRFLLQMRDVCVGSY